jgi:hypothetical protein
MTKNLCLTALALTLIVNLQTAQARDPAVIAQNTINKVSALSQSFSENMQAKADTAAIKITNLITAGKITAAQRLADRTIKSIRSIRNRGLNLVNRMCNSTYIKMLDLGEFVLADQVLSACTTTNNLLWDSADQAIATVNAAL